MLQYCLQYSITILIAVFCYNIVCCIMSQYCLLYGVTILFAVSVKIVCCMVSQYCLLDGFTILFAVWFHNIVCCMVTCNFNYSVTCVMGRGISSGLSVCSILVIPSWFITLHFLIIVFKVEP